MNKNEAPDKHRKENDRLHSLDKSQPSLSSLIIWNVSKALEKDSHIDLQHAVTLANERLQHQSLDVNDLISQDPEDRYIACAVLAWQQLGHKDTESLYEFIESHRNKILRNTSENSSKQENIYTINSSDAPRRPRGFIDHKPSMDRSSVGSTSFDTYSLIGPVVKLPVETKIVMRVENSSQCAHNAVKKSPKDSVKNKIDAACCQDTECSQRLKELEKATAELRTRATQLARREAERAELLERAEAAWRDLEIGYQRRLIAAEEKEADIIKQITKSIEDRNAYKQACSVLAQQLSKRAEIVEKERVRLNEVEKKVCELACTRLRLSEESAKGDAAVVDHQCKIVQLERDLQFKEEQARRKLLSIQSAVDSSRGLTLELERVMRDELGLIKEQVTQVSAHLLEEDAESTQLKTELDEIRQQKAEVTEDLEGCNHMCDSRIQGITDELNKKRQLLKELKDKVIECECKLPLDEAVEVKRTPSLAALCRCTADDHIIHSCSCSSVRSTLLSNLLSDLFAGLQAELGDTGSLMPCQLLKCLEDKHNWDRASVVKNNLRSFFSKLLVGELDNAIATSIENYHATWVGVSCVDKSKVNPDQAGAESEEWHEKMLESRAQQLASQIAEQLFEERAEQLVKRAKDIVTSGPPPCECRPQSSKISTYPCLVKAPTVGSNNKKTESAYPTYVKRTLQNITLLRAQIEDLKKETINKEDLRIMEEKITKTVQRASGPETTPVPKYKSLEDHTMKQKLIQRSMNTDDFKGLNENIYSFTKKKTVNAVKKTNKKTTEINGRVNDGKVTAKTYKKIEPSYAINLCLCDAKKKPETRLENITYPNQMDSCEKPSQNALPQTPSIKHSRPINKRLSRNNQALKNRKKSSKSGCLSRCTCFHKTPSNTSINKLLGILLQQNNDLSYTALNINEVPSIITKSNYNNIKENHHDSAFSVNKKSVKMSNGQETRSQNISHIRSVKDAEIDQVPPLTTSEYIGAVNLDKSNEHICTCHKEKELERENKINSANLLFKCVDTSNCCCEKSNDIFINNRDGRSVTSKNKDLNVIAFTHIKQLNDTQSIPQDKLQSAEACKSLTVLKSHKTNQTSESNIFSSDRDFHVKFLGVTLTDINKIDASIVKRGIECSKSNYKSSILKHKPNQTKRPSEEVQNFHVVEDVQSKTDKCQFVELYTNLDNNINNCKVSRQSRKNDECLSEIYDTKSCVCCNYDEETKNLEVNTFTLLEKHLKRQLVEIRKSGKSDSILPDEEEKVFVSLSDKVKKVISDYICKTKCECSVDSKNIGSWTRFNNLLEEYLKIKIKRVQCTCTPNQESLETMLPNVLDQVTNLIENDFERLKNIYKNEKSNCLEYEKYNGKDYSQQNVIINTVSEHVQPDVQFIDFESISIQTSCNLASDDKSCNAIQYKDKKDMQTSHKDLLLKSQSVEVDEGHLCDLNNKLKCNMFASSEEIESKSEIIHKIPLTTQTSLNKLQDNKNEINKINSHRSLDVPYVGCTLSCSCDHLYSSICTKTLSPSYVKNIHSIWKMVEMNKALLPKLSYIMHGIPKAVRSENNTINYCEVTNDPTEPLMPEPQNIKDVSAIDGEEIVLKDSDKKLKQGVINDNMTSTFDDFISIKTDSLIDVDAPYWYDCPSSHNIKNEGIHKKALYDSVYSSIGKLSKHGKSDTSVKNNIRMCISKSKKCNCAMVPVCHVKMLVENIESKLVNSQCTCDSLSAQVCPVHSKMLF